MQLYLLTSSIHSILGMNAFLFIECPINLKIIKHKKAYYLESNRLKIVFLKQIQMFLFSLSISF